MMMINTANLTFYSEFSDADKGRLLTVKSKEKG
jgi:hypothetical protein